MSAIKTPFVWTSGSGHIRAEGWRALQHEEEFKKKIMLRVVLYSLKLNPVIRENENGMSMFCFVYLFLFPLQFWHKQHRVDPTTFQTIPLLHTTFNCALLHTCGCLKPNFLD